MNPIQRLDDGLTLLLERRLAAPRAAIWRCWSEAALLQQWFCPKPWWVEAADMQLRPGGRFNLTMCGPDGERMPSQGCFLEVSPGRRLQFTDSFSEGFRPLAEPFMTGVVEFSDTDDGATLMRWSARHASVESAEKHLTMGFEPGWNAAADQLEALAASLPVTSADEESAFATCAPKVRSCVFLAKQAEEAAHYYVSLLPDSRIERVYRPDPDGPALVVEFVLAGTPYMAMNGNPDPKPDPTVSISVLTADQAETDTLWQRLCIEGGVALACGWLQDRFGVHWQIVPEALPRLMGSSDLAATGRVQQALMGMQKIEIDALQRAHDGA